MDGILNYSPNPDEDYYNILECDELSSVEQINAEYKVLVLTCHPDKHPDDPEAADRFARLQCAKETLCDPAKRQKFDKWRRSGLCMSYATWCSKQDSLHASLHWASKKKKEPMLPCADPDGEKAQPNTGTNTHEYKKEWQSQSTSDALQRFRNYEI